MNTATFLLIVSVVFTSQINGEETTTQSVISPHPTVGPGPDGKAFFMPEGECNEMKADKEAIYAAAVSGGLMDEVKYLSFKCQNIAPIANEFLKESII